MAGTDRDDAALAALFQAARAAPPAPGPDLMARVLTDALAAQAGFSPGAGVVPIYAPVALPRWRLLVAVLGGRPGLGGLALAGVAGLWIGVSPPQALERLPLAGLDAAAADFADFFPSEGLDFAALEEG